MPVISGKVQVRRRPVWQRPVVAVAAAVVVALGVVAVVVLAQRSGEPAAGRQDARARVYRDTEVCLLTGPTGIASGDGAGAWAGLQTFSQQTSSRVSYLAVTGTRQADAAGYLAGLLQRRCQVIVAVGPAQVGAVEAVAAERVAQHFVLVGGTGSGPNVQGVPGGKGLQEGLVGALRAAAAS